MLVAFVISGSDNSGDFKTMFHFPPKFITDLKESNVLHLGKILNEMCI